MKKNHLRGILKVILPVLLIITSKNMTAQGHRATSNSKDDFWKNVQIGGGLGVSLGTGYTDLSISPSAIYNFDQYFALGLGLQYTYIKQKNFFDSHLYGGSIIGLFNPIREVQLSAELEELRVDINSNSSFPSESFWNTGLFLGVGYRSGNATIGVRYNVLFDENKNVYNDPFMPFVRFYF